MTKAAAREALEGLLAGPIGREEFDQLTEQIYASYSAVDLTDSRIRRMEEDLAGLSGNEKRDLTEKLGILHFARGDYGAAAQKLEAVCTRKTAAHFLGRACRELGREREALEYLEAGRSGDDDLLTDVLLVETYCSLQEPEEAEKLFKRHSGATDQPELHYARGRMAEAQGEYGQAMGHYEEAIDKEPDHAPSLFRLALNCDVNGDDERAMELYKRCARLRPAFVGALLNLGVLYEDHDMYYEAIDCYKRVLAIDPAHAQAHLYLKDAESSLTMHI
ncbi:MAG: tetratricopeptide repeat protein, partial [Planctomycetota bacterium]